MPLKTILAMVMLLGSTLAAGAQSEIVSVTDWRAHAGDDLAWAQPDLKLGDAVVSGCGRRWDELNERGDDKSCRAKPSRTLTKSHPQPDIQ